jgi:RNA polymerase sigma-70 factor, ECF subfamily
MSAELEMPQEVLLRCCQRDREAFRQLVEQLKRPAYYHALALLGHAEDAMDVSQEAFVKAWQSIGSFRCDDLFYPWYYTILKRLALNQLRTRKRHPHSSLYEYSDRQQDHEWEAEFAGQPAGAAISPVTGY